PRYMAIIREIHTYGQLQPIVGFTKSNISGPQHRGLGKRLIAQAEKITRAELSRSGKKEFKIKKIAVISGVGVRGYYRKLGYFLEDTYMVKNLASREPWPSAKELY
ncbi:MAG: hypothetical protein ABIG29_02180, partial [Candidatus Nealsonbacteria bacterium]